MRGIKIMSESHERRCPECGAALADGFIGFFSGIMWYDSETRGWQRVIPFCLKAGRFLVSNVASTPWTRIRRARICRDCGTLVVPA